MKWAHGIRIGQAIPDVQMREWSMQQWNDRNALSHASISIGSWIRKLACRGRERFAGFPELKRAFRPCWLLNPSLFRIASLPPNFTYFSNSFAGVHWLCWSSLLRLPHLSTDAARRFWRRRLVMAPPCVQWRKEGVFPQICNQFISIIQVRPK